MEPQSMSDPSGSENRFFRNQTEQFNSELRTEEHSVRKASNLAEDRKQPETVRLPWLGSFRKSRAQLNHEFEQAIHKKT